MKRILLSLILILTVALLPKADDFTLLVADGDLPYTKQHWFYTGYGKALDELQIKKYWDEDFRITSAAYTGRGWFVVMSKNSGIGAQTYWYKNAWPDEWLKEKWPKDYRMTECSYGEGGWLIVMSKGTGITEQITNYGSSSGLAKWIKEKWDEGYRITLVTPMDDKWYVVMSKNCGIGRQTYDVFDSYASAKNFINKYWDEEYYLTQLSENASGNYFCVMSGKDKSTKQSYFTSKSANAGNWIDKQWSEGKNIAQICGGFRKQQSADTGNYAAATTNRSTTTMTTATQQQPTQPKKYREELGYGMFAIITKYGDDISLRELYAPCSICHGTMKCGNCYGSGRCQGCYGKGSTYSYLYGYSPCPMCTGTGICAICSGSGVCPCAGNEYPGYALSNTLSTFPGGSFSTATPRGETDSSAPADGQTYSRNSCPRCGGTGINPTPNEGPYNSNIKFLGYSNQPGNKCPYCGRYTSHYHEKCLGCNVPTY